MPFSIFNFFFNRKLIFSRDLMNHCTKYQQRIQKLFFLTKSRFLYIFLPPVKNFFFFHVLWPRWTIVPEVFALLNLKHKPPPPYWYSSSSSFQWYPFQCFTLPCQWIFNWNVTFGPHFLSICAVTPIFLRVCTIGQLQNR